MSTPERGPSVHPPMVAVRDAVARALAEDLLPMGDLTASLLPPEVTATGHFVARRDGVVAGRRCVEEAFLQVGGDVDLRWHLDDGDEVAAGSAIAEAVGSLAAILSTERTALNFLCHLSGIATMTRRFVRTARDRTRILDTRKTTPGLRALEKAAVRAGGGVNHRGSLSEAVLVKDNHLVGMSISDAVRRARLRWPGRMVEVECDQLSQVVEAVEAGATMVLLDNMTPEQVGEAVRVVAGRSLVEVSGGVTVETLGAYADQGPDFVSSGALTHSAPVLDIGLDISE